MGDERPTLYLSNFASYRTPGMHGPGRKFTIMARPREWERGDGTVPLLTPASHDFTTAMMIQALAERGTPEGEVSMRRYRVSMELRWETVVGRLAPRALSHVAGPGGMGGGLTGDVFDGDTLCCACSVAEARAGRCHRTWAAPFLVRAGWRVVLDGEVVDGC